VCGGNLAWPGSMLGESHDVKASLTESLTKAPQDKAWFIEGVSKGRQLVTLDRSWSVTAVPESLLQSVKPLPMNAGEWATSGRPFRLTVSWGTTWRPTFVTIHPLPQ
jgi:hypothetical protein